MERFLAFLAVAAVLIVTPGPDTALTIRNGLISGRRGGMLSNLGNPKMAIFFISLLPQFVVAGHGTFSALMALGIIFAVMTFAWLTLYSVVVARAGDFLQRSRVRRTLDGLTGAVLIGFGIRVATDRA